MVYYPNMIKYFSFILLLLVTTAQLSGQGINLLNDASTCSVILNTQSSYTKEVTKEIQKAKENKVTGLANKKIDRLIPANRTLPENIDSLFCTSSTLVIHTSNYLTNITWDLTSDSTTILSTTDSLLLSPPIQPGLYAAHGTNNLGELETHYYLVETPIQPQIVTPNLTPCRYETTTMENSISPASGCYEYDWTPITYLSDPNLLNPTVTPEEDITYTLTISSPTGCYTPVITTLFVDVQGGALSDMDVNAYPTTVCAGEEIQLFGNINEVIIEDNFDPGISWAYWCSNNGEVNSTCGSISGSALYFNAVDERSCTTNAMDVTNGGLISFYIKIASETAPCDDAEEGDDIVLEYSTNGCNGDFTVLETFNEASYPDFTLITLPIPIEARTSTTQFRWRQLNHSGENTDNWILDNLRISIFNSSGFDVLWSSTEMIDNPDSLITSSTPQQSATYYLEITDLLSNCVYDDSIYIVVNPAVEFSLPNDISICESTPMEITPTFTSTGNYQYLWNSSDSVFDNDTNQVIIVTPTETTTYSLQTLDTITQCQNSDEITITVNDLWGITLNATDSILCYGDSALISMQIHGYSDDITITWGSSTTYTYMDSLTIYSSTEQTGTYWATVIDNNSTCIFQDTIPIIVSENFSIITPPDVSTCNAINLSLTVNSVGIAPNDLTWEWLPNIGLSNYTSPTIQITENNTLVYQITATDQYGCSSSDSISLNIVDEDIDFGEDTYLCPSDSILLQTGYDNTYNTIVWNTGSENSSMWISSPGSYVVTVTSDLGCFSTDSIAIMQGQIPFLDLPPTISGCLNDEITLSAGTNANNILWNTGATTSEIAIEETGCYSVEITNDQGCHNADTTCVSINPIPEILLPDSAFACIGEVIQLAAGTSTSYTYLWNTGDTTSVIEVMQPGTYQVSVTNEQQCIAEGTVSTFFSVVPEISLPEDIVKCEGDTLEVTAQTDGEYIVWNTGSNEATITVTQSGYYIATAYNNELCSSSADINISLTPYVATSFPNDTSLCLHDYPSGYPLSAGSGGYSYVWNTGATSPTIQIFNSGIYHVVVDNGYGCLTNESVKITNFCPGENLFIPNAFTPDGDGINDYFFVKGNNIAKFEIRIYNRNGQVIWLSRDIDQPWDGSYFGGHYYGESDVYSYIIDYSFYLNSREKQTETYTTTGKITMIR